MGALKDLVDEGKIRSFELSNESAWGTAQWLQAGEKTGGPRIASIQNEYSVLCRMPYDADMAELGHNEDMHSGVFASSDGIYYGQIFGWCLTKGSPRNCGWFSAHFPAS